MYSSEVIKATRCFVVCIFDNLKAVSTNHFILLQHTHEANRWSDLVCVLNTDQNQSRMTHQTPKCCGLNMYIYYVHKKGFRQIIVYFRKDLFI